LSSASAAAVAYDRAERVAWRDLTVFEEDLGATLVLLLPDVVKDPLELLAKNMLVKAREGVYK
jgi:hypothetical protein